MITLITSKICCATYELNMLQKFEASCSAYGNWELRSGPLLFCPLAFSARLYTLLHYLITPALKRRSIKGAVLSLGLPRRLFFFSKTFPWFSYENEFRVLWAANVWQRDYPEIEQLILKGKVNLLLLSAHQPAEYFHKLRIPGCKVNWVPETIDTAAYPQLKWSERRIDIRTSGPVWSRYHHAITDGCTENGISYISSGGNEPGELAATRICICFPQSLTNPQIAGNVSALTGYYLQAMAARCLIIGLPPLDLSYLLTYPAVVAVDWADPVGQIKDILANPARWQRLIEKNYQMACTIFNHRTAIAQISRLIKEEQTIRS